MRTVALVPTLCLLAAPLLAQAPPEKKPPEQKPLGLLGELFLRAGNQGALDRLDGERWFRLQSDVGGDAVVVVRIRPADDPPVLVIETVLSTLGQDPAADMHTQVLLAPDGRMHGFRSALRVGGRGESRAEGKVDGRTLKLEVTEAGKEPKRSEREWDPEAIPEQALTFVVPLLHDQLAADETKLVVFEETSAKLAPRVLRRARSAPGASPELVTLTVAHQVEKDQVQLVARCQPDGKIFELRREHAVMRALPPAEARALLQRERGRVEVGPDTIPPPPPDTPTPPPAPR